MQIEIATDRLFRRKTFGHVIKSGKPEKHAVTENTFLLEGGQTSAGSTMDWIVKTVGKTFADFANIEGWG